MYCVFETVWRAAMPFFALNPSVLGYLTSMPRFAIILLEKCFLVVPYTKDGVLKGEMHGIQTSACTYGVQPA